MEASRAENPSERPDNLAAEGKSSRSSRAIALLVAACFFMEHLDSTVIATALPQMAISFGENPVDLNMGLTAYLFALAIFIPLSGWLAGGTTGSETGLCDGNRRLHAGIGAVRVQSEFMAVYLCACLAGAGWSDDGARRPRGGAAGDIEAGSVAFNCLSHLACAVWAINRASTGWADHNVCFVAVDLLFKRAFRSDSLHADATNDPAHSQ